jgi:glycosyltransferase involved in cell wall biosynthesis
MACGRCVVTSDIPQNIETTGDGGVTFASGNALALPRALERLLGDAELIRARGASAHRRVHEVYDRERVVDRLEALFEGSLGTEKQCLRCPDGHLGRVTPPRVIP